MLRRGFGIALVLSLAFCPGVCAAAIPPCPPLPIYDWRGDTLEASVQELHAFLSDLEIPSEALVHPAHGAVELQLFVPACQKIQDAQGSDDWKIDQLRQAWVIHVGRVVDPADEKVAARIGAVERWKRRWFHKDTSANSKAGRDFHVVVDTPAIQDLDKSLAQYVDDHPEVYFEIWKVLKKDYYAITVGTGLSETTADRLVNIMARKGMANAYLWQPPKSTD